MGKRRTAFLIAGVLAAAALTGCGGASGEKTGAKEKVRLMVWSSSEDQSKDSGQWLQNSCEDFAELHPEWDITFVYGIADEATAANQVAQDPEASADVFMYANDTLTIMTDANALTKFGGRYREEIETTNSPEVLESLVKDGDLYGVPFTTNTWFMYYDKVIHSMVQFADGAVIAQLGTPDMKLPIQYALYYPERRFLPGERLDFAKLGSITFEDPDMEVFRGLKLAYRAGKRGGSLPTVYNAANEYAVGKFLNREISYLTIIDMIEGAMEHHKVVENPDVDAILAAERETYEYIESRW